jgi:eukaryotic-like serine/threonine-protein kinase
MVVNHLNSIGIYHRDLKPANFLIKTDSNGKIYLHLTDFGVAKNTSDPDRQETQKGKPKGTFAYLPPEFQEEQKEKPDISKIDVWSVGVIGY